MVYGSPEGTPLQIRCSLMVFLYTVLIGMSGCAKKSTPPDPDESPSGLNEHTDIEAPASLLTQSGATPSESHPSEKDARVVELRLQAEMAILNDEPRAALNYFSELIQIDPADWEAYRGRAGAHGFLQDFEAAVTDLSTAIKLQPDEAELYFLRGVAKAQFDLNREAIADFDQAIQLKRNYADAHASRGILQIKLGNLHRARTDLDSALAMESPFAEQGLRLLAAQESRSSAMKRSSELTAQLNALDSCREALHDSAAAFDKTLEEGELLRDFASAGGWLTKAMDHLDKRENRLRNLKQAASMLPEAVAVESGLERATLASAKELFEVEYAIETKIIDSRRTLLVDFLGKVYANGSKKDSAAGRDYSAMVIAELVRRFRAGRLE